MVNLRTRDLLKSAMEYLGRWKDIPKADKKPASYLKFRAQIAGDIQTTFVELEDDLCLMIDPKSRVFSRGILIKNYGFPDVKCPPVKPLPPKICAEAGPTSILHR